MQAAVMAGSGFYSGLQLKNQVFDQPSDEEDNVLKLRLPKDKLKGIAKQSDQKPLAREAHSQLNNYLGKTLAKPITIGVGGMVGFHGAAKQYEDTERKHYQGELDKAEKEYLDLLSHVKTSSCDNTPLVDAFCHGIVSMAISSPQEIDKVAKEDDMADGSMKRVLGDALSPIAAPYHAVKNMAYGGLAAATLGSAGTVYLLKQKFDKAKGDGKAPTRIEIEGV